MGALCLLLLTLGTAAALPTSMGGSDAHHGAGSSGAVSTLPTLPLLSASGPGVSLSSFAKMVNITLSSPKPESSAEFGLSVAVGGNIVAVGVLHGAVKGVTGGYAELFNETTGALIANLTSPNECSCGNFGQSIAISGGIVIVGAPGETASGLEDAGHAYTFRAKTGALIDTLTSPNAQSGGGFGISVAISGGIAVVGAPSESINGTSVGHAYAFNAKTGALIRTLASPHPQVAAEFGWSVAISGKVAMVGAPLGENATGVLGPGHAYTFNVQTGAFIRKFSSLHPRTDGFFGGSVAILGGIAVVGAPNENARGVGESGHAYIFDATTGAVIKTLSDPHAKPAGTFGWSVAISGKTVIVGAQAYYAVGPTYTGYAYEFSTSTGHRIATFTSPKPQLGEGFGYSVAVSGGVVVVGAPYQVVDGFGDAGLAYIFEKS